MRHLSLVLSAALVLAGCGSSSNEAPNDLGSSAEPGGTDQGATDPGAGVGGGEGGSIPSIANGMWKSGTAHVEVSGDATLTTDLELVGAASITAEGLTSLPYFTGQGESAVNLQVVLDRDTGGTLSLTSGQGIFGGGPEQGCVTDVSQNEATRLEATITCRGVNGLPVGSLGELTVDMVVTLTAER